MHIATFHLSATKVQHNQKHFLGGNRSFFRLQDHSGYNSVQLGITWYNSVQLSTTLKNINFLDELANILFLHLSDLPFEQSKYFLSLLQKFQIVTLKDERMSVTKPTTQISLHMVLLKGVLVVKYLQIEIFALSFLTEAKLQESFKIL